MIIERNNYCIISKSPNEAYFWDNKFYPQWSGIVNFIQVPMQKTGIGVEPHYHDCDEIWLFTKGNGDAWLDGKIYDITPNTVVYTPMGAVHRFQMFSNFEIVELITRLEGKKRPIHILVEEHGPPEKTAPGFVISGENNKGPFKKRVKDVL